MFKIIYLSMSNEDTIFDGHTFNLLDESFTNFSDAKKFVNELIEKTQADTIDDMDEDEFEFSVWDKDDEGAEIIHECECMGDLFFRDEYKIVEVR